MELRSPSVVYSHCTCTTLPSSYDCLIRHGGSNGLSVRHPPLLPFCPLLFRPGLNSSPVNSSSLVISPHRVLLPCPALSCSPCCQLTTPNAARPSVSSTCLRENDHSLSLFDGQSLPELAGSSEQLPASTAPAPRVRSPETAAVFPVAQTIKTHRSRPSHLPRPWPAGGYSWRSTEQLPRLSATVNEIKGGAKYSV